jgi:DNA-binding NarL/FixJ family response regulator
MPITACIRVFVVEDHAPYREFIMSVVQSRSELQVIAQAADGTEAVRIAEELRPDLILLDIGLPGLNGIEAARRILPLSPQSKILFVSQESSQELVSEALSTGASGYVLKADAGSELMAAVNCVLLGEKFMSSSISTG